MWTSNKQTDNQTDSQTLRTSVNKCWFHVSAFFLFFLFHIILLWSSSKLMESEHEEKRVKINLLLLTKQNKDENLSEASKQSWILWNTIFIFVLVNSTKNESNHSLAVSSHYVAFLIYNYKHFHRRLPVFDSTVCHWQKILPILA